MFRTDLTARQEPPPSSSPPPDRDSDPSARECTGDWCGSGNNIKYGVVGGIIALIIIWVTVGAVHARHRVRRGKKPLFYHRWFVATPPTHAPVHNYAPYGMHNTYWGSTNAYQRNPNHDAYGMQAWAPPPPAYTADIPPTYQAPPDKGDAAATVNATRADGAQEASSSVEAREQAQADAANAASQTSAVQRPQPSHQASDQGARYA